jgi:hypothetical protein
VGTSHNTLERLALRVIAFSQLAVKGLNSILKSAIKLLVATEGDKMDILVLPMT